MEGAINEGYGLVLTNGSTTDRLAHLFTIKPLWTSKELNEELGWQFSQAVFNLRQRMKGTDTKIFTRHLGKREYAYEMVMN